MSVWWGVRSGHCIACAGCLVSWAGATVLYSYQQPGPGDVLQVSVCPRISNSKHIICPCPCHHEKPNYNYQRERGLENWPRWPVRVPSDPWVTGGRERHVDQFVKLVLTICKHGDIINTVANPPPSIAKVNIGLMQRESYQGTISGASATLTMTTPMKITSPWRASDRAALKGFQN